ncbi:hypothetical protein JYT83_00075 [bacterium AH-315-F18]|nr:hypothetical protein [bacterium AH-315-F18]
MSDTTPKTEFNVMLEDLEGIDAQVALCLALGKYVLAELKAQRASVAAESKAKAPEDTEETREREEAPKPEKGTYFPRNTWGWLRTYYKGIGQSDAEAKISIAKLKRQEGEDLVKLRSQQFHEVTGILQEQGKTYAEAREEFAQMDIEQAEVFVSLSNKMQKTTGHTPMDSYAA